MNQKSQEIKQANKSNKLINQTSQSITQANK